MDMTHGSSTEGSPVARTQAPESASSSSTTLTNLGRKRALLIGIRGYPELKAPHADVQEMRKLLIETSHCAPDDIRVLIDDEVEGHVPNSTN
ncbi:hypothetical protein FB451DRAFT_1259436 [Mycena latifolia]|nr:hypothetical protein FB451DRAFT_1259436 [Mycena latifolia]